jgi:hypothetical protein
MGCRGTAEDPGWCRTREGARYLDGIAGSCSALLLTLGRVFKRQDGVSMESRTGPLRL